MRRFYTRHNPIGETTFVSMEIQILGRDLCVFYKEVKNYPEGVAATFHALENLHPSICERSFFGISYEQKNQFPIYWAAVEENYQGEGARYGCTSFVIRRGTYLTETIPDFMRNITSIPNAFSTLLSDPRRDEKFPCIEWYKNDLEMTCMVKLKSEALVN